MIRPDSTTLELVIEAATDPVLVLQVCQGRLIEARDVARMGFDEYKAAQLVREVSAILKACADAMQAHALANPFRKPGRKQIAKAQAALATDAAQATLDAALSAWEQV